MHNAMLQSSDIIRSVMCLVLMYGIGWVVVAMNFVTQSAAAVSSGCRTVRSSPPPLLLTRLYSPSPHEGVDLCSCFTLT